MHGIGSPHTPAGYIWHIALAMQGSENTEREELLQMLLSTTADTGYRHESFDADDPKKFTCSWFAWANSLCAEFIVSFVQGWSTHTNIVLSGASRATRRTMFMRSKGINTGRDIGMDSMKGLRKSGSSLLAQVAESLEIH